nr:MAG TPA: virion assembly protein [Caudoviricetes sp.]
MGFSIKKAFKKVAKVATFGAYRGGSGGGGAVEAPAPAPELGLTNQEGEAEQKEEPTKVKYRKGKKALKITKNDIPATGAGRNIV